MRNASALLQELYESDIDAAMSSMARQGFIAEVGMDGEVVEAVHVDSYAEACEWLTRAAIRLYPTSRFARKYADPSKVVTLPAKRQPRWSSQG